jgi:hypothetical protein
VPALLVVEDLDVSEQLRLRVRVGVEVFAELELYRGEEALHDGVVVAVSSAARASRQPVMTKQALAIIPAVGASLVGVVQ